MRGKSNMWIFKFKIFQKLKFVKKNLFDLPLFLRFNCAINGLSGFPFYYKAFFMLENNISNSKDQ